MGLRVSGLALLWALRGRLAPHQRPEARRKSPSFLRLSPLDRCGPIPNKWLLWGEQRRPARPGTLAQRAATHGQEAPCAPAVCHGTVKRAVHTCASPFTCHLQRGQLSPGLGVSLIPQFCSPMGPWAAPGAGCVLLQCLTSPPSDRFLPFSRQSAPFYLVGQTQGCRAEGRGFRKGSELQDGPS